MNDDPELNDGFNEEEFNFDENQDFFPKYYDLEKVFDETIQPLLKTLVNICNEYSIPMVSSVQYKNNESQVMLCTSIVIPPDRTCDKLHAAVKELLD